MNGNQLTCFGVNGVYWRVYSLDQDWNVWELGWNGNNCEICS